MAGHDIIVIGGSAGSIEALSTILSRVPADLPASICVALHQSAYSPNRRPEIFSRVSRLPVVLAEQGMCLRRGTVYLAAQDMHLMLERSASDELGTLRLVRGPKENRARPSVDPLSRTAALAFGRRVIAVVLSGALDDGTAGLWAVKDREGIAVVQDPRDAAVSSMPMHAIEEVGVDHVVTAEELGPLLGELARRPIGPSMRPDSRPEHDEDATGEHATPLIVASVSHASRPNGTTGDIEREVAISLLNEDAHSDGPRYGAPSRFACPDCGGVLWAAAVRGAPAHFRCETGHAYAAASLAEAQTEAVEAAMWAALRALEDKVELARVRAGVAHEPGLQQQVQQFELQSYAAQEHAAAIRALLRLDGRAGIRPATLRTSSHRNADLGGDRPGVVAGSERRAR